MQNKIQGLRTVIYKVGDIEKATKWYSQVLETEPYFNEPYYVGFNADGYELGLQPEEQRNNDQKTPNVIAYWGVEDVEHWYRKLLELGATIHEEPTDVGGDIVVATVKDPWGNVFGIIYNPHFKLPD